MNAKYYPVAEGIANGFERTMKTEVEFYNRDFIVMDYKFPRRIGSTTALIIFTQKTLQKARQEGTNAWFYYVGRTAYYNDIFRYSDIEYLCHTGNLNQKLRGHSIHNHGTKDDKVFFIFDNSFDIDATETVKQRAFDILYGYSIHFQGIKTIINIESR